MSNNTNRQLNIELLRIFSMLLITVWHVYCHFIGALHLENSLSKTFMVYVSYFIPFHVDLFILIMGYFGIRDSRKKLLKTMLLIYFYSITLNVVSWLLSGEYSISDALFPVSRKAWWFMTMYVVMLMVAPIIEKYVSSIKVGGAYLLVGGGLFVNLYLGYFHHVDGIYEQGNGMTNFVCMYLIGVWIRIAGIRLLQSLASYCKVFILLAIILVIGLQYKLMPYMTWMEMTEYCSVYPIVMSVLVFILFLSMKVPESFRKLILFFSSSAIAVYLITDYVFIRNMLVPLFSEWYLPYHDSIFGIGIVFLSALVAYICSCIIDRLRIPVTEFLYHKMSRLLKI